MGFNKRPEDSRKQSNLHAFTLQNIRSARKNWIVSVEQRAVLKTLTEEFQLSVVLGDLRLLDSKWYVTHSGLMRLARRNRCIGIEIRPVYQFCDPAASRWAFRATVYKSRTCKGFVGYGDANPSNVSDLVRGAEMRVAETRAVNRALRKAYGIGLCSVEEIGSFSVRSESAAKPSKFPPARVPGNGHGLAQPRLRDRLCQLIRQHRLDPVLVKSYAVDFCGTKTLSEASREQVERFINDLAEKAVNDREGLLCRLNSYAQPQEVAS